MRFTLTNRVQETGHRSPGLTTGSPSAGLSTNDCGQSLGSPERRGLDYREERRPDFGTSSPVRADYLTKKKMGVWPDDPLIGHVPLPKRRLARPDLHPVARTTSMTAASTPREADAATGISEKTIRKPPSTATVWPHMAMIARLENKLGIPLWVGQHNDGHGTKLEPSATRLPRRRKMAHGASHRRRTARSRTRQRISTSFANAYGRFRDIDAAVTKLEVSRGVIESLLNGAAWLDVPTLAPRRTQSADATMEEPTSGLVRPGIGPAVMLEDADSYARVLRAALRSPSMTALAVLMYRRSIRLVIVSSSIADQRMRVGHLDLLVELSCILAVVLCCSLKQLPRILRLR